MSEPAVSDLTATVDTYLSAWSEPDAAAPGGTRSSRSGPPTAGSIDPPLAAEGHAGISRAGGRAADAFPGHTFRRASGVDAHHDQLRFAWELVGPDGAVALTGLDVGEVAPDGRLHRIAGFFGDVPARDAVAGARWRGCRGQGDRLRRMAETVLVDAPPVRRRDRRHLAGVDPVVAARPGAAAGRAEHRARSSSTTSATPSSAATAPTSPRPRSTGSRPAACASPTSTPPRCARRRARACMTGRNHHSVGMGRISDLAGRLPRLQRPHRREPRLRAGDPRARTGTRPTPSASGTSPRGRDPHGRATRELAGRAAASSGGTASTAARPTSSSRRCTRTTSRSRPPRRTRGRLPPHRRPRRPRHRVPRRPPRRRRRAAVLPLLRDRRLPLAAPRAGRVDRTLRRPLRRRLGRRGASRTFARQLELGLLPPGTELSPRPPWVPAWDELPADEQRVAARFMECFAGYLSHADAQIGRLLRFIEDELGEGDDTLVRARLRQRRERRGRRARARSTTSGSGTGCRPGRRELQARIGELGSADRAQQLSVGLDHGREHPVQALEARGARGRRRRPVHRALAATASPARGEVRHQFAHAIDVLPTVLELVGVDAPEEHRRASRRRRSRARASRPASTTPPPRGRARHPVLRDARQPGHPPRRLEGGDVQAPGPHVRRRPTTPTLPFDEDRVGAVPRRRGLLRVPRPRRARAGAARRRWSSGGGRKRGATRCCRSTTGRSPRLLNPRPTRRRDRTRVRRSARWARRFPRPVAAERPQPLPRRAGRARRGPRARRRTACWSRRVRCSAAGRSTCSTAACTTSTTSSARNDTA